MQEYTPLQGSLVLYKSRPAVITGVSDKIEIEIEGGKSKRVRAKDIAVLHPGPLDDLARLTQPTGDVTEAWELVSGGSSNLGELAELIFAAFTPSTAWATWQLVAEGLYFEGTPDQIIARDAEQVEAEIARRQAKAAEQEAWQGFLDRLSAKQLIAEDRVRLQEVERLALGHSDRSRIMVALGWQENAENAHRMLLSLGYWQQEFNPYPRRLALPTENPDIALAELPSEQRRDLTGMPAFAIDDEESKDPDDAISLDGQRIWVHVADVAALVTPDSDLDLEARSRGANLYLPDVTIHMLPPALTQSLGLGLQARSPALSFGFHVDDGGEVTDFELVPSWVQVTRLSYGAVEEKLDQEPFASLLRMTRSYRQRRVEAGAAALDLPEVSVRVTEKGEIRIRPQQRLESREMVTDAMLMAGEAVARYALDQGIPVPFATQPPPENPQQPMDLASMYAYRRQLRPSRSKMQEEPHAGLGLSAYTRATSPLRRYPDLVTHQQLRAHLRGETPRPLSAVSEQIAAAEVVGGSIRRAERLSNLHWKLVYLQRNPKWRGKGVVVETIERRATLIIPELALETKLRLPQELPLNTELALSVQEIDLADQVARFRLLN
jgi:exoribonuclease-2